MAKTAMIRARIEPELKTEAEEILGQLGLSATQAITLFYRQVVLQRRLPLELAVPNEITREVFRKTDSGEDMVRCSSADDMFEKLGI
jgi:DNA-damage-inducible protein J